MESSCRFSPEHRQRVIRVKAVRYFGPQLIRHKREFHTVDSGHSGWNRAVIRLSCSNIRLYPSSF
jgi:hypothetical protein